MKNELSEEFSISGYEIRNIKELEFAQLVRSDIPQEIVLAILGDFHDSPPEMVIQRILNRLFEISRGELELQKYIRQLNILSRLRKLQHLTIKTIKNMPISYDIQKDELFLEGMKKGLEQGRAMAKNEKMNIIRNLLLLGTLTISQIASLTETEESLILEIKAEIEEEE